MRSLTVRPNFCGRHRAHVEVLQGDDAVEAILHFASEHRITQIFVGHSQQTGPGKGWLSRWRVNPVERFIMEAEGIDVRIFPSSEPATPAPVGAGNE